jgi:hypothetical protein
MPSDVIVLEENGARIRHFKAGDDAQERRFAGTGWTQQRNQLTGRTVDGDIIERNERAESLGNVLCRDRHRCCSAENAEKN